MVSLDPIEIDRLIFGVYFGVLYTAFTSSDPPKIQEISGPTRISKLNAEQKKIREYLSNIDT
jgi:hypothetical protein